MFMFDVKLQYQKCTTENETGQNFLLKLPLIYELGHVSLSLLAMENLFHIHYWSSSVHSDQIISKTYTLQAHIIFHTTYSSAHFCNFLFTLTIKNASQKHTSTLSSIQISFATYLSILS